GAGSARPNEATAVAQRPRLVRRSSRLSMRLPRRRRNRRRIYLGLPTRSNPTTDCLERSCRPRGPNGGHMRETKRETQRVRTARSPTSSGCLTTKLSGRPTRPDQRRECHNGLAFAPQLITHHGPLQRKLDSAFECEQLRNLNLARNVCAWTTVL